MLTFICRYIVLENAAQFTIVKSNKVVETRYMLTLAEQRISHQIDAKLELTEYYRFEVTTSGVADLPLSLDFNKYKLKRVA